MTARRLALLLFAFSAACGLLRWIQTFATISAEAVRFAHLNDVVWEDFSRRVSRTGTDPYLVLDLPYYAIPVRAVSFYFIGDYVPTEGQFYLLPSSGDEPNIKTGATVTAHVQTASDALVVSGMLEDATRLRLDLPDFLPRSLQLDRIVIRRPFIHWPSWSFRMMIMGFAGGIATLLVALRHRVRSR